MSNRRITASTKLAPVQELAVQPFSTYNSDSVNKITRIVTGLRDKDIVVGGLHVQGNPDDNSIIYGNTLINDNFSTLSANWDLVAGNFVYNTQSLYAETIPDSIINFEARYNSAPSNPTPYRWYEIKFNLTTLKDGVSGKGTPRYIYLTYGNVTEILNYPTQNDYTVDIQAEISEGFKIVIVLDSNNPFNPDSCRIDNIVVKEVLKKASYIEPITDQTVNQSCIHSPWLRPHTSCRISAGVAIKDDVMLNILGTDPENKPATELIYLDDDSWIKGPLSIGGNATGAYTDGDFSTPDKVSAFGMADDGDPENVYYCNHPSDGGADFKWGYLCLYYSYYKNPLPNTSYIGFARDEEINDPIYGEDYLPLAKLRFVQKDVVDAIFYYPVRNDWGVIDAVNTSYAFLNDLRHWETRPRNVSIALDILAARIYEMKRFQINWSEINSGDWPVARPTDWLWYNETPNPHLGNSDKVGSKDSEFTEGGTLSETYKTLEEAMYEWPESYYIVLGTGPGAGTVVNPNSIYGNGTVPGTSTDDVKFNKFLRADNTWQYAATDYKFYLHGWPQVDMYVGQMIISSPRLITKMYYSSDTVPSGNSLRFVLKRFRSGAWTTIFSTGTIPTSYSARTVISETISSNNNLIENDILAVQITHIGTEPYEGGNNLYITIN